MLFRYNGGSVMEYACRKRRMILQENPEADEELMIILILMGLTIKMQQRIDRGKIKTLKNLIEEIASIPNEITYERSNFQSDNKFNKRNKPKFEGKDPECKICASLGWPGRRHLATNCRNQDKIKKDVKQANVANKHSIGIFVCSNDQNYTYDFRSAVRIHEDTTNSQLF